MRRRKGFTLVECLAAIAMIGAAMTTVAVAMSGMHRACQRVREEIASEMELQRLAVQLRADAHEALSAKQEEGEEENAAPGSVLLALGNEESVQYTVQAGHIQRVQRRGDELLHRETYRLPEEYSAHWELKKNGSAPMVSLKLEPHPVELSGRMGDRPVQINAAVGLLTQGPTQPES